MFFKKGHYYTLKKNHPIFQSSRNQILFSFLTEKGNEQFWNLHMIEGFRKHPTQKIISVTKCDDKRYSIIFENVHSTNSYFYFEEEFEKKNSLKNLLKFR